MLNPFVNAMGAGLHGKPLLSMGFAHVDLSSDA
jgi:hypothetical protein